MSANRASTLYLLFLIFDLLVLPKFLVSTPLSFFLAPFFFLLIPTVRYSHLVVYVAFVFVLLASVLFGSIHYPDNFSENIKRAIQLALVFLLFLYSYDKVDLYYLLLWLRKILIFYYALVLLFLVIFFFSIDSYSYFMKSFFPETLPMLSVNIEHQRFSFHFTDPNAMGYLISIILAFQLALRLPVREHVIYIAVALIIILATQSRGALLSYGLVTISYFMLILNWRSKLYLLFMLFLVCFFVLFLFDSYVDLYINAMQVRTDAEASIGSGLGGGRIDSWYYFFNNINYNPIWGQGYALERDGALYRPHSDFIRLNLSYGILVYFLIAIILREACARHIMLLFSFLVPFFINTIIDDYRLLGVFLVFYFFISLVNKRRQLSEV